jgi:hypothetical protein
VTVGAYLSAIDAIGLQLDLTDPRAARAPTPSLALPTRVRLADYPQLKQLAWQRPGVDEISPAEALSLYERNWRHVNPAQLTPAERALVQMLSSQLGGGALLV